MGQWKEKWLERGLLAELKSLHLRGEEELQEYSFILYKHELFQIVVRHKIINKMVDKAF